MNNPDTLAASALDLYRRAYQRTATSRQKILDLNWLINFINARLESAPPDVDQVFVSIGQRYPSFQVATEVADNLKLRGFQVEIQGNGSEDADDPVCNNFWNLNVSRNDSTLMQMPTYYGDTFEIPTDKGLAESDELAYYKRHFELLGWYTTKLVDIVNAYEYIGDLSQNVWDMSYAEDVVREYWSKGSLNQAVKDYVDVSGLSAAKKLGELYREDGDYQGELTRLIARIMAWPTEWSYDLNTLDSLTIAEVALVKPLRVACGDWHSESHTADTVKVERQLEWLRRTLFEDSMRDYLNIWTTITDEIDQATN